MHNIITIGRRKTSTARVVLKSGNGAILVNKKSLDDYFKVDTLIHNVMKPIEVISAAGKYDVAATVAGGGPTGQAGAVMLGIARALVEMNEENRSPLRNAGLLTRDPRMVERKKYGQKKARKRFQFSKR
jgi:small subunit ribosomal protein S9